MQRLRQESRLLIVCVSVLGLLLLSSCAAPTTSSATSPAADQSNTMSDGVVSPSTVHPSATSDGAKPPVVVVPGPAEPGNAGNQAAGLPAWVPIGPADPADPPPDGWYSQLVNKACDNMAGDDSLVNAARALCVAVTNDTPEAWAEAAALLSTAPAPAASDCLQSATYKVLVNVVNYRQTHPGSGAETAPGTGTACPLGMTGVALLVGDGSAADSTVSASPGTSLRLVGRFLDVGVVLLNGEAVSASRSAENNFTFIVPDGLPAGTVTVQAVRNDGVQLTGSASFTVMSTAPSRGS